MENTAPIYELYIIKPGETLEEIALRFDMKLSELQRFHNENCAGAGLRWFNNFVGVREILVPKNHKSEAVRKKELLKYFPGKTFSEDFYDSSYSVKELFEKNGEPTIEIEYAVELRFEKEKDEKVACLSASSFRKNGTEPDDKISSLAIACMRAAGPIAFFPDDEGKLKKIARPESYSKRFAELKGDIADFHVGEISEAYIANFEDVLNNPELVWERMTSLLYVQVLFPGMKIFHRTRNWTDEMVVFPNSIPVKFEFSASYHYENLDVSEVHIKGILAENISTLEIVRGVRFEELLEEPAEVIINLSYRTDKERKKLLSVSAEVVIFHDGEVYSTQKLTIVPTFQKMM